MASQPGISNASILNIHSISNHFQCTDQIQSDDRLWQNKYYIAFFCAYFHISIGQQKVFQHFCYFLTNGINAGHFFSSSFSLISFFQFSHFNAAQTTLAVLDKLDLDNEHEASEETVARMFGFEENLMNLSYWQRTKPKIWALFDEPSSSNYAKVSRFRIIAIMQNVHFLKDRPSLTCLAN